MKNVVFSVFEDGTTKTFVDELEVNGVACLTGSVGVLPGNHPGQVSWLFEVDEIIHRVSSTPKREVVAEGVTYTFEVEE